MRDLEAGEMRAARRPAVAEEGAAGLSVEVPLQARSRAARDFRPDLRHLAPSSLNPHSRDNLLISDVEPHFS